MTKAKIVKEIHVRTGIQRQVAMSIVNEFMNTVKDEMAEGNNVYLRGFGTFAVRRYAEKRVYNINTDSYKMVAAHNVPSFKPGKDMLSLVKNKK